LPRKGEHLSEEEKRSSQKHARGKKLGEEARIRFLEGKKKYYEAYFSLHHHHPNKGKHAGTEFKKGNTLWVGRHHTEESKMKISAALKGKHTGTLETAETRAKKSRSHIGQIPWNRGLTRKTSPSLARIGEATKRRWTPEMRQRLRERNTRFWSDFWSKHPEAKATLTQVSRPTRIELMARESISKRGIVMIVSKRLEDICYPDIILPTLKIAIFCHGCFWHACALHNPVVPSWLRAKIKDQFVEDELTKRGWRVLVVWEHEFKTDKDAAGLKLDAMLNSSTSGS